MKTYFILLFIILFYDASVAEMSSFSKKLERYRIAVGENQSSKSDLEYLNNFPATFNKFCYTFYGYECEGSGKRSELYKTSYQHLMLLKKFSRRYPEKVYFIWLSIASDAYWKADAVGLLQHQLIENIANETEFFVQNIQKLPLSNKIAVIQFLADVENHSIYFEYKRVINNLIELGQLELADSFVETRSNRINQNQLNHKELE